MNRRIILLALLLGSAGVSGAFAQEDGTRIAERFQRLSADTRWREVGRVEMQFDTYHPQGMAIVGEHIYISSVEVIDRAKGVGRAHLFKCDEKGKLLERIRLEEGKIYHPGGIDFDGERLWVPVAEYRPDSRSVIFSIDPKDMSATRVFEFADHLGGVLRDAKSNALIGNSWGSRRFYRWEMQAGAPLRASSPTMRSNPSHYVDYQDGQWLRGTNLMVCSGVESYRVRGRREGSFALGGMALIDTRTFEVVHEIPVPLWTSGSRPMTQNPFYVVATEEGLRFYFMPEDNRSTMYTYEPVLK